MNGFANLVYEAAYWREAPGARLAGVDEAGRGPLAGPVVAGAVVIAETDVARLAECELAGLTDSKKLSEREREKFYGILTAHPAVDWAAGMCSNVEIDELNILRATHLAMARAVSGLWGGVPDHALVDGLPVKGLPCGHTAIVKGDAKSLLIAAASVIAKVTRDRIMRELDGEYPGYGFAKHKGYPTKAHVEAVGRLGVSEIHRKTFKLFFD